MKTQALSERESRNTAAVLQAEKGGLKRLALLDTIRGLTLISMILYHASWDAVYLFDLSWPWFHSDGVYLWQQSICWTFILLSGFCWPLGRRSARRGLVVFAAGAIISLITVLFVPENRIVFGVLTLLGSCMLLMLPAENLLRRVPAAAGLTASALPFILLRGVNEGYLGIGGWSLQLPERLYQGPLATYLGFMDPSFYSTDYFSLLPWSFLFAAGYFLCRLIEPAQKKIRAFEREISLVSSVGKRSLPVYLLHQPVIYLLLFSIDASLLSCVV